MISKTNTLENMCELVVDCPHFTPKWTDNGLIVLRNQNIKGGTLDLSNPSYTNEGDFQKRIKRAAPQVGDIVFTREAPMGEVCLIPEGLKCCLGQRQVLLRPKKEVNGKYLFWALQSPYVQQQIFWNEGTGSTVSNVRIPVLKNLNIPRHKGNEDQIADILSSIADKISLNHQINQTLESMAQAIFKSWFVDFEPVKAKIAALEAGEDAEGVTCAAMRVISGKTDDELDQLQAEQPEYYAQLKNTSELFPSAMQDSELGKVPEGWEVGSISDITDKIFSGGTPNTKTKAFWNGELNWFSSGETRNIVIVDTEKKITEKGAKDSSTKLAIYGDILIASAGQGHTRGQTSFCAMDTFINQSVISIRTRDIRLSSWLFFNLSRRYEEMRSISDSHSIRGSLTTKLLSGLSIIILSESLCIEYGKIADRSLIIIAENIRQSEVLSKLRDTLLPKLLSGSLK
jgi:type I restriction enzyme S subunit